MRKESIGVDMRQGIIALAVMALFFLNCARGCAQKSIFFKYNTIETHYYGGAMVESYQEDGSFKIAGSKLTQTQGDYTNTQCIEQIGDNHYQECGEGGEYIFAYEGEKPIVVWYPDMGSHYLVFRRL